MPFTRVHVRYCGRVSGSAARCAERLLVVPVRCLPPALAGGLQAQYVNDREPASAGFLADLWALALLLEPGSRLKPAGGKKRGGLPPPAKAGGKQQTTADTWR